MSDVKGSSPLGHGTSWSGLQEKFGGLDDDLKLRASKSFGGDVTLFATDRATGAWGRLTGLSREREAARDSLKDWFKAQYGPTLAPEVKAIFAQHLGTGDVTVGKLKALMAALDAPAAPAPGPPGVLGPPAPNYRPYGPDLAGPVLEDGRLDGASAGLGGKEYRITKHLGTGSFGQVHLAVSADGERIAVKMLNPGRPHRDIQAEAELHKSLMESGSDISHIVALKGIFLDGEGNVQGVATEAMMGGDVNGAAGKIADAEREGRITADEGRLLRLTMLKDMAKGVSQLHDARGKMHLDVKPANFLVNERGVTKIADFGTIRPVEVGPDEDVTGVGTILYMAPEGLSTTDALRALQGEFRKQRGAFESENPGVPYTASDRLNALFAELDEHRQNRQSDIFSLGLSGVKLFKDVKAGDNLYKAISRIMDIGGDDPAKRDAAFEHLKIAGNAPEDALLRAMLAAKPGDRPNAGQIATMPPLDDPRVGSRETRSLLAKVVTGKA